MSLGRCVATVIKRSMSMVSPELNTRVLYRAKFGRRLDLSNPATLNEKVLWLKLNTYRDNELVRRCADKYRVREYVESCGLERILPLLVGAYDRPDEIRLAALPERFALKLNVGCGFNHIVCDKSAVGETQIRQEVGRWLKAAPTYWLGYSELQYRDVACKVLVEEYLGGPGGELPLDYKLYCINGRCEMVMLCTGRGANGHGAQYWFMDRDWNLVAGDEPCAGCPVGRPKQLDEAIQVAETLSKPFPFVRVDLYLVGDRIYFGEMTFTPAAGMDVDHKRTVLGSDEDIDRYLGEKLVI